MFAALAAALFDRHARYVCPISCGNSVTRSKVRERSMFALPLLAD